MSDVNYALPAPPISRPISSQEIGPQGMMVPMGSDDLLVVRFYKRPVHNPIKSKEAGSPVYDAKDYVFIQQPGERDNTDRPAHDGDKARFWRQWQQYQNNIAQVPEGTPLSVLFVDPNEINIPPFLNGLGIYTVEQLENITEVAVQNIGLGGRDWVNKAKKYREYANKGQNYHKLDRDLSTAHNKLQVQEQQIEALKRQVDQLLAERYGQSGHPNPRRPALGSLNQQQFEQPEPQGEPVEPDLGLNPDTEPVKVFADPGRKGRR